MYHPEHLELELQIDAAARRLVKEPTQESWQELASLIGQRTPERVAEMEHERGLR